MKPTNFKTLMAFTWLPFDRQEWARKAALVVWGIMRARSPRPTEIPRPQAKRTPYVGMELPRLGGHL